VEQNSQNHPAGVSNRFFIHPDWSIEILSEQNQTKVLGAALLSAALNWDGCSTRQKSILVVFPIRVQLLRGTTQLPILNGIPLQLTVEQVFD